MDFVADAVGLFAFEGAGFVGWDFDVYSPGGFDGVEDGFGWEKSESGFGFWVWRFGGVSVVELFAEDLVSAADADHGYASIGGFDDGFIESS